MRTRICLPVLLVLFVLIFNSCTKDVVDTQQYYYTDAEYQTLSKTLDLPEVASDYHFEMPEHFKSGNPSQQRIDRDKATLGRVLFYDKTLSRNEKVSCASCHDQAKAFADPVAFSEGFEGVLTKRNSFALGAVASFTTSYNTNSFINGPGQLFWDNRAATIQEQSTQTLQDPIEMGMDMDELVSRVRSKDYYQILFDKAFTGPITQQKLLDAIAEFINAMVFSDTRFDQELERHKHLNAPFSNFTAAENLGKSLFHDNCVVCHGDHQVRTFQPAANNGLDLVYEDKGVGEITGRSTDLGVFKVPLLRNVELTGPYMHDGRFETLEEVIEHYNSGIQDHPNLNPALQNHPDRTPKRLNLTDEEKAALVSFLKTLTDTRVTTAEEFSNPFRY